MEILSEKSPLALIRGSSPRRFLPCLPWRTTELPLVLLRAPLVECRALLGNLENPARYRAHSDFIGRRSGRRLNGRVRHYPPESLDEFAAVRGRSRANRENRFASAVCKFRSALLSSRLEIPGEIRITGEAFGLAHILSCMHLARCETFTLLVTPTFPFVLEIEYPRG